MLKLVTVVVKLATLLPVDENTSVFDSWWLNHQLVVESTIGGKDTKMCQNLQLVAKTPRVSTWRWKQQVPHLLKNSGVEVVFCQKLFGFGIIGIHRNRWPTHWPTLSGLFRCILCVSACVCFRKSGQNDVNSGSSSVLPSSVANRTKH